MASQQTRDQVFTSARRRVLRKRIPSSEILFGALFLLFLAIVAAWVVSTREDFDPSDRDITIEALAKGSIAQDLYHQPLVRWTEGHPASAAVAPDTGLFPASLLDGGWSIDGRVESWDPETVYEKINGAAEQYIRYGFELLTYVTLEKDGFYLTIEDYDQGGFPGALGIFAAQRDPSRTVEMVEGLYVYRTSVGYIGLNENHYFKLTGSAADAVVLEKASQLLGVLGQLPTRGSGASRIFDALTSGLGCSFEQVSYEASNAFKFDFLERFWFARPGEGDLRVFAHEAASADEAQETVGRLISEQRYEYESVQSAVDRHLLKHRFLATWFSVARRGRLIYGVERAADRESAEQMTGRIAEILGD